MDEADVADAGAADLGSESECGAVVRCDSVYAMEGFGVEYCERG